MSDTVVLGRIEESFHQVAAAVVEEVLLRLGHTVEVHEGPHPRMYPMLAEGRLDLFADAWLPAGHEVYWEQVRDHVVEVAPLYDDALFFWVVPGHLPEDITSLHDLARPEVAGRFSTRVVQGTTGAAGLSMRSDRLITEYGLDRLGWSHVYGDLQAIIDTIERGMAAGEWFASPLWQPMYLNERFDLRPLDDPLGVFPPADRASLLAHREAWGRLPERTREVLGKIRCTVADVNFMDAGMQLRGHDALGAVREWLEQRPELARSWGL